MWDSGDFLYLSTRLARALARNLVSKATNKMADTGIAMQMPTTIFVIVAIRAFWIKPALPSVIRAETTGDSLPERWLAAARISHVCRND
jgi:hypothetical protein